MVGRNYRDMKNIFNDDDDDDDWNDDVHRSYNYINDESIETKVKFEFK